MISPPATPIEAALAAPPRSRCRDVILGERDMMTPRQGGRALAAAIAECRTIVLPAPATC